MTGGFTSPPSSSGSASEQRQHQQRHGAHVNVVFDEPFSMLVDLNAADATDAFGISLQALDERLQSNGESPAATASRKHHNAPRTHAGLAPGASTSRTPPRTRPSATVRSVAGIGGAVASASIEDDRRKRHNANERRRTNALKTRILDMRDELAALERERDRLQANSPVIQRAAEQEQQEPNPSSDPRAFLDLVATIDRLRLEKAQLQRHVQQWDMQNSTYQTILSEFGVGDDSSGSAASAGASARRRKKRPASSVAASAHLSPTVNALDDDHIGRYSSPTGYSHGKDATTPSSNDDGGSGDLIDNDRGDDDDGDDPLTSESAPIFQKVLFASPMPLAEALECVRSSYNEIMAFRSQRVFDSLGGEVLGWRDKRLLRGDSLQFMLAQRFDAVLAHELVYKTWNLLTTLLLYRRIQPRTTELQILQRVNRDCVIVRLSVGRNDEQHHTILLIARGRIDGGFLITYRSIPLSEAKQRFAETEGTYVSIFNWFMFLDTASASGVGDACEVIFGGKVKNRSAEYLRYLMMEVVAGVVRWQTAVGHSKLRLTN